MFSDVMLGVVGDKEMSHNDKNMEDRISSIMVLRVGTACGVNGRERDRKSGV